MLIIVDDEYFFLVRHSRSRREPAAEAPLPQKATLTLFQRDVKNPFAAARRAWHRSIECLVLPKGAFCVKFAVFSGAFNETHSKVCDGRSAR